MKNRANIQQAFILGLLLLFAVSATPWQWLHTVLYPHAHSHSHKAEDGKARFEKYTLHCHCTHDFHPTPCILHYEAVTVGVQARFLLQPTAQWQNHFYSIPRYFFSLHGPPALYTFS